MAKLVRRLRSGYCVLTAALAAGNPALGLSQWVCGGLLALGVAAVGHSQSSGPGTPSSQSIRRIGVVTAVDPAAGRITIKTDAGQESGVLWQGATVFVRVAPGEKDLSKATKIVPVEISVGDRILARGRLSEDQKSILAAGVIVMSKTDIAKKQEVERADWQRRGVAGIVQAINAPAGEITLTQSTFEGPKPLAVVAPAGTVLRRYAPDSVKFSDAKPSTVAEVKIGDQLRARGNKNEDASGLTAEEIVFGTFRDIAGTVVSVDPQGGTVKITDLATKKPLLVRINSDSNLRKLPPIVAQMMAARRAGAQPGGGPQGATPGGREPESSLPAQGGARANLTQDAPSRAPGRADGTTDGGPRRASGGGGSPGDAGGGRTGRGGAADFSQMLQRMPALTLADLKPGDAVIVASTSGRDPAEVTAITLLAGVEPLLEATPARDRQAMLDSWNLDLNMNISMP